MIMHSTCSFINTSLANMHLHPYFLDTTTPIVIMPRCQQHHLQSKEEHSTPFTPFSLNHEHQGRIESWFEGNEDNIQMFLIEMTRK